mgnify:FL=1
MREIKFRVWDKKEKLMVGGEYWLLASNGKVYEYSMGKLYEATDKYEIIQYTGLHDKNGKEIYTDDILLVKKENIEFLATPQFSLAYMGYALCSPINTLSVPYDKNGKGIEQCGMSDYVTFLQENCSAFEIVGNIYENENLIN